MGLLKRLRIASYFRGAFIFKHIRGWLDVFFHPVKRSDVLLRGEIIEGASFVLQNLSLRTDLLEALRLPLCVQSFTIGKLLISGLDSVAHGGRVSVTLSEISLVVRCPSALSSSSPEEIAAARRTLIELLAHLPWIDESSDGTCRSFVEKVLGGATVFEKGIKIIHETQKGGTTAEKDNTREVASKLKAAAKANAAEESRKAAAEKADAKAAQDQEKWLQWASRNIELAFQNVHIRVEGPAVDVPNDMAVEKSLNCSAVGITIPQIRLQSSDKQSLWRKNQPRPSRLVSKATFSKHLSISNIAMYIDPSTASYDFSPETKKSRSLFSPLGGTGNKTERTKTDEIEETIGARQVLELRSKWSQDRHNAFLFPINCACLFSMTLSELSNKASTANNSDGKNGAQSTCEEKQERKVSSKKSDDNSSLFDMIDSLEVNVSPVIECIDLNQTRVVEAMVAAIALYLRRDYCCTNLYRLIGGSPGHILPRYGPPNASMQMPRQNILPRPIRARQPCAELTATKWLRLCAANRSVWARMCWHWAISTVMNDLKTDPKKGDERKTKRCWGSALLAVRSQRRLIELYKRRHRRSLKRDALSDTNMTNESASASSHISDDHNEMIIIGTAIRSTKDVISSEVEKQRCESAGGIGNMDQNMRLRCIAASLENLFSRASKALLCDYLRTDSNCAVTGAAYIPVFLNKDDETEALQDEWEIASLELGMPCFLSLTTVVKHFGICEQFYQSIQHSPSLSGLSPRGVLLCRNLARLEMLIEDTRGAAAHAASFNASVASNIDEIMKLTLREASLLTSDFLLFASLEGHCEPASSVLSSSLGIYFDFKTASKWQSRFLLPFEFREAAVKEYEENQELLASLDEIIVQNGVVSAAEAVTKATVKGTGRAAVAAGRATGRAARATFNAARNHANPLRWFGGGSDGCDHENENREKSKPFCDSSIISTGTTSSTEATPALSTAFDEKICAVPTDTFLKDSIDLKEREKLHPPQRYLKIVVESISVELRSNYHPDTDTKRPLLRFEIGPICIVTTEKLMINSNIFMKENNDSALIRTKTKHIRTTGTFDSFKVMEWLTASEPFNPFDSFPLRSSHDSLPQQSNELYPSPVTEGASIIHKSAASREPGIISKAIQLHKEGIINEEELNMMISKDLEIQSEVADTDIEDATKINEEKISTPTDTEATIILNSIGSKGTMPFYTVKYAFSHMNQLIITDTPFEVSLPKGCVNSNTYQERSHQQWKLYASTDSSHHEIHIDIGLRLQALLDEIIGPVFSHNNLSKPGKAPTPSAEELVRGRTLIDIIYGIGRSFIAHVPFRKQGITVPPRKHFLHGFGNHAQIQIVSPAIRLRKLEDAKVHVEEKCDDADSTFFDDVFKLEVSKIQENHQDFFPESGLINPENTSITTQSSTTCSIPSSCLSVCKNYDEVELVIGGVKIKENMKI